MKYDSVATRRYDSPYGEARFEYFDVDEDEVCNFFIDDEI
jgi:hypothetical protein